MLSQAIRDFPKQFAFEPKVVNDGSLKSATKFLVAGMGGSNHATDILKCWRPAFNVITHRDYGLPTLHDPSRLVIACAYSGNTEEPIDALEVARAQGRPLAVVAKGGRLLELARQYSLPYVVILDTGIQPRSATGFMFTALLKLMGDEADLKEASALANILDPAALETPGRELARKIAGVVPVIYSSTRNAAIANNWKIKINENAKIPAFANVFPELNHNEMNGFSAQGGSLSVRQAGASGGDVPAHRVLSEKFHFIFLKDSEDDSRVIRRMEVLRTLYEDRGLPVAEVGLTGSTRLEKIFSSLILADWTSLALAENYGIDPEPVPMVEEFKKLIA